MGSKLSKSTPKDEDVVDQAMKKTSLGTKLRSSSSVLTLNQERNTIIALRTSISEALRTKYASPWQLPALPWVKQQPVAMEDFFIDLQVIHIDPADETSSRETYEPINLQDILHLEENVCPRIVIGGGPGYGKSVLVHKLVYDWANKADYLSQFDLVAVLPLRLISLYGSVENLLAEEVRVHQISNYRVLSAIDIYPEKTLLILDGFSELNNTQRHTMFDEFIKKLSPQMSVIVTSRLHDVRLLQRHFVKTVHIIGFTLEQRKTFLKRFYTDDEEELMNQVWEYIEEGPQRELFTRPIFLYIFCLIAKYHIIELPLDKTEIYTHFIDFIVQQNVPGNYNEVDLFGRRGEIYPEDAEQFLTTLGILSSYSNNDGSIVFEEMGIPENTKRDLDQNPGFLVKRQTNINGKLIYFYEPVLLFIFEILYCMFCWRGNLEELNIKMYQQLSCDLKIWNYKQPDLPLILLDLVYSKNNAVRDCLLHSLAEFRLQSFLEAYNEYMELGRDASVWIKFLPTNWPLKILVSESNVQISDCRIDSKTRTILQHAVERGHIEGFHVDIHFVPDDEIIKELEDESDLIPTGFLSPKLEVKAEDCIVNMDVVVYVVEHLKPTKLCIHGTQSSKLFPMEFLRKLLDLELYLEEMDFESLELSPTDVEFLNEVIMKTDIHKLHLENIYQVELDSLNEDKKFFIGSDDNISMGESVLMPLLQSLHLLPLQSLVLKHNGLSEIDVAVLCTHSSESPTLCELELIESSDFVCFVPVEEVKRWATKGKKWKRLHFENILFESSGPIDDGHIFECIDLTFLGRFSYQKHTANLLKFCHAETVKCQGDFLRRVAIELPDKWFGFDAITDLCIRDTHFDHYAPLVARMQYLASLKWVCMDEQLESNADVWADVFQMKGIRHFEVEVSTFNTFLHVLRYLAKMAGNAIQTDQIHAINNVSFGSVANSATSTSSIGQMNTLVRLGAVKIALNSENNPNFSAEVCTLKIMYYILERNTIEDAFSKLLNYRIDDTVTRMKINKMEEDRRKLVISQLETEANYSWVFSVPHFGL